MEVVDAGYRFSFERDNQIARSQSRALGWATAFNRNDYNPAFLRQVMKAHEAAGQRHGLSHQANVAATNAAVAQQAPGDKLCGVDADGEAQSLRRQNRCGVEI